MRADYKRDVHGNYLIMQGEKEFDVSSYQVRMLLSSEIPFLLRCRLQGMDGEKLFYYEITSRQSLTSLYDEKKLYFQDLQEIFGSFVDVIEKLAEYLLNPDQLVLRPEYIYMDVEKRKLYFCYLPGFNKSIRQQFQELTEYILPKLNHEDQKAVLLGYGIYRHALEDTFQLEHIKEEVYRIQSNGSMMENSKKESAESSQEKDGQSAVEDAEKEFLFMENPAKAEKKNENRNENKNENRNENRKNTAQNRSKLWILLLGIVLTVCILAAVTISGYLGYIRIPGTEQLIGVFLICMGVGCLFAYLVQKKDSEESGKFLECADIHTLEQIGFPGSEELHSSILEPADKNTERNEYVHGSGVRETYTSETVVLSEERVSGPATLVSREPGELATIYLKEDLTVIGKLEGAADAVIALPTVSRLHAKIRKKEGEYYLSDLNSKNGTAVNGRLLKPEEEYQLKEEDEVDLAQARYIFLK